MAKRSKKRKYNPTKYTPEFMDKFGKDLDAWSRKENSYFITHFLAEYNPVMRIEKIDELRMNYPDFEDLYYKVRERLVNKLRCNAMTRKLDGGFVARVLGIIDPEYRQMQKENLKIAGESNNERVINIAITPSRGLPALEDASKDVTVKAVEIKKDAK